MLQAKFDFTLNFSNLGWFSIFLKKIENQPRLEKFNLKSNLTWNIPVGIGLGEKPLLIPPLTVKLVLRRGACQKQKLKTGWV